LDYLDLSRRDGREYSGEHEMTLRELMRTEYIPWKWKQLFLRAPSYVTPVLQYAVGGKYGKIQLMTAEQYQKLTTPIEQKGKKPKKETKGKSINLGSEEEDTDPDLAESSDEDPVSLKTGTIDLVANGNRSSARQQEVQSCINLTIAKPHRWLKVTLTVPLAVDDLNQILDKTFRYTFSKLEQPNMTAIWRKEYQARGVEHFHLLVYLPGNGMIIDEEVARFSAIFFMNWQRRVINACGRGPSRKAFNCKSIECQKELESEFVYQRKEEKNAKALRLEKAAEGKKGKRWGILNRKAYKALVTIKIVKLENIEHFFTLKRHLYLLTNAELRSLKSKHRRRKMRFQVDSRFFFLTSKQIEAALKASTQQIIPVVQTLTPAQVRRRELALGPRKLFKIDHTTFLRCSNNYVAGGSDSSTYSIQV